MFGEQTVGPVKNGLQVSGRVFRKRMSVTVGPVKNGLQVSGRVFRKRMSVTRFCVSGDLFPPVWR